ncbi:UNVERIFIED_CONTAM: hypothetical protein PYX00_008522 [Menopon gallinae]|uniref:Uncharacterized protein n=1 Tax=Menopon gallinae TaxID=328185 RepID=A0AAW2HPI2_9NEOP
MVRNRSGLGSITSVLVKLRGASDKILYFAHFRNRRSNRVRNLVKMTEVSPMPEAKPKSPLPGNYEEYPARPNSVSPAPSPQTGKDTF